MTTEAERRRQVEHRLDILARQLERVGLGGPFLVSPRDAPGRAALRRTASRAVDAAGLSDQLEAARRRFGDWVQAALSRTRSDLKAIQWVTGTALGPTEDRVDVLAAVDDAVLATVATGLIAEADRAELLEPYGRLMGLAIQPPADRPN